MGSDEDKKGIDSDFDYDEDFSDLFSDEGEDSDGNDGFDGENTEEKGEIPVREETYSDNSHGSKASEAEENNKNKNYSFEESASRINLRSINPSYRPRKKPRTDSSFYLRGLAVIFCASLLLYCAYAITTRIVDDVSTKSLLDDLAETADTKPVLSRIAPTKSSNPTETLYDSLGIKSMDVEWEEIEYTGEYDSIRYKLRELKSKNEDTYGWIRCVGGMTEINLPIVQSDDNVYYLTRNHLKEESVSGAIFADYRNSRSLGDNYNAIFYGHCMTNGTMFRAIKNWYESGTRTSTAGQISIEIITFDGVYIYEIFASYRSAGNNFIRVSFPSNDAYKEYLQGLLDISVLKRNVTYSETSRIITLSTCTNSVSDPDERYVVHGILKKIIKFK